MLLFWFVWCNCWITYNGWKNIQWLSDWIVKWNLKVIKAYLIHNFLVCSCSGDIYHIKFKNLVCIHESIFHNTISTYTFVFLYNLLVYMGFEFTVNHPCHLGFQWRVHPQRELGYNPLGLHCFRLLDSILPLWYDTFGRARKGHITQMSYFA